VLKSNLVGGLHFKGSFGEPGASLVKPLHGGFELIGLLFVRQKLYLQSQFHRRALSKSEHVRLVQYRARKQAAVS